MSETFKKYLLGKIRTAQFPELTTDQFNTKKQTFLKRAENISPLLKTALEEYFETDIGKDTLKYLPDGLQLIKNDKHSCRASPDLGIVTFSTDELQPGREEPLIEAVAHEFSHLKQGAQGVTQGISAECNLDEFFVQRMMIEAQSYTAGFIPYVEKRVSTDFADTHPSYRKEILASFSKHTFHSLTGPTPKNSEAQWFRTTYEPYNLHALLRYIRSDNPMTGNPEYHDAAIRKLSEGMGVEDVEKMKKVSTWLSPENQETFDNIKAAEKTFRITGKRQPIALMDKQLRERFKLER